MSDEKKDDWKQLMFGLLDTLLTKQFGKAAKFVVVVNPEKGHDAEMFGNVEQDIWRSFVRSADNHFTNEETGFDMKTLKEVLGKQIVEQVDTNASGKD